MSRRLDNGLQYPPLRRINNRLEESPCMKHASLMLKSNVGFAVPIFVSSCCPRYCVSSEGSART